jgi:hypothetical protein
MRKIRIRKKQKRRIRIKRNGVPHRVVAGLARRMPKRRIRIKKKPKRRIRIKRNGVPHRVVAVFARMRRGGESLSQAARAEHTTPRTIRKWAGNQLKRSISGSYLVTAGDTLKRELNVLGFLGYESVVVRSFKQAHLASEHLIAISRFLRTGDARLLRPFRGKRVGGVRLLTDPDRIREFAEADLVKLDSLYRNQ